MSLTDLLMVNGAVTGALMVMLWCASVVLRDVSIVDVFWGFGFVVIAGTTCFLTGDLTSRKALILALTSAWGLRLTLHLARRKWGSAEDYRYRDMRARIGPRFWFVSLAVVFGLQGVIMNLVALPLLTGQLDASPLGWLDALGLAFWSVGFLFEAVGDLQLTNFRADPGNEGKVLDQGLWRYTRHPNYFGNFMVWWGIFLTSVGAGGTWWTIISPLLMSFLLLRVSGVTLLESSLRERKAGYADYVARTSPFFPWPPRAVVDSLK